SGDAAIAVGTFNTATGHRSTALGYEADALADDSVALGSESLADEANTVSVGREGFERRIVNVADGDLSATSTDAVNGRQLFGAMDAAAAALGGGAAVTAGGFVAPTYVIQGSSYNNVGAALDALDAKVTEIDGRVDTLEGNPNVASTDSDAPPTASSNGELDRSSGDASNRVAGEPGSGDMSSVMDGDSDKGGRPSVGGISTGGNQQVATNAGGLPTQNRVGGGVGFQGGESAISVGYRRAVSDRAVIPIGGAFSGDESSVGLGAGFGW